MAFRCNRQDRRSGKPCQYASDRQWNVERHIQKRHGEKIRDGFIHYSPGRAVAAVDHETTRAELPAPAQHPPAESMPISFATFCGVFSAVAPVLGLPSSTELISPSASFEKRISPKISSPRRIREILSPPHTPTAVQSIDYTSPGSYPQSSKSGSPATISTHQLSGLQTPSTPELPSSAESTINHGVVSHTETPPERATLSTSAKRKSSSSSPCTVQSSHDASPTPSPLPSSLSTVESIPQTQQQWDERREHQRDHRKRRKVATSPSSRTVMPTYNCKRSHRWARQQRAAEWLTEFAFDEFHKHFGTLVRRWGVKESQSSTCVLNPVDWAGMDPLKIAEIFSYEKCPLYWADPIVSKPSGQTLLNQKGGKR